VKFLLDENLSARLTLELQTEGVDAVHVRERGLLGATDPQVLERAYEEDRVLVTANVDDFVRLARSVPLHPGLVLIEEGGLTREEQTQVIRAALAHLEAEKQAGRDLVNRVLRIWLDGEAIFEDIPRPGPP
jgi:predicted nuclease of predicted toxin-antitoxin system